MKKTKLAETRIHKGFTQQQLADGLCMDKSNYNRRETGQAGISNREWEKLSEILSVPVEEIYEAEEGNFFVFRDNKGKYLGSNNIYSVPEHLLESQRKYIQKLEEEIKKLKEGG